jgi:hypothetical protein
MGWGTSEVRIGVVSGARGDELRPVDADIAIDEADVAAAMTATVSRVVYIFVLSC